MIGRDRRIKIIGLLFLVCLVVTSCGYSDRDAKKYLPGSYFYEIQNGEFQVLKIYSDLTFKQIIYSKNKKDILYKNNGKMYVSSNEIEFENWLQCFNVSKPTEKLLKPYIIHFVGIYWRKPKGNEDVSIIIFDQSNYVFRKKKYTHYNPSGLDSKWQ